MMDGPAPIVIEVADDRPGPTPTGTTPNTKTFLASGDPAFEWIMPQDEWESLALNYTSGTTGRPKGVVYHHRGAYLMTMGTAVDWAMPLRRAVSDDRAAVSLQRLEPHLDDAHRRRHRGVLPRHHRRPRSTTPSPTKASRHFGGAPIVLNMIVNAKDADRRAFDHVVEVFTAGAPPPAATLAAIEPLGFNVTQVYGLTETYGHVTECIWKRQWDAPAR